MGEGGAHAPRAHLTCAHHISLRLRPSSHTTAARALSLNPPSTTRGMTLICHPAPAATSWQATFRAIFALFAGVLRSCRATRPRRRCSRRERALLTSSSLMAVRVSPATPRMRHPFTASVPPSSTTCTFAPISPSPAAPRHPSLRCSCGPVRCPCAASCTGTFPWVPLTMPVRGLASRGRTGLWELLEFGTCIDGMAGRRLPSPSRRGTARAAAGGWPAGAVGQRPGVAGAAPPAAGDARAPRVAQRRVFWCVRLFRTAHGSRAME